MTLTVPVNRVATPRGRWASFATRDDTSDAPLVGGILGEDEYGLAALPKLSGWAIDIGAHIGTVAVALAVDHPELNVVAVEALPDNVEMLRRNVALNDLNDRVFVESAAAGTEAEFMAGTMVPITYGWERSENQPDAYMHDNRYIGGMVKANSTSSSVTCRSLSLGGIFQAYKIDRAALLKIDCEGCEWFVLTSSYVARIDRIVGEMHAGRHGGAARLRELLEPTHTVEMDDSRNVAPFVAVRR